MYRRKPQAVIDRSPQRTIDLTSAHLRSLSDYARAIQLLSTPNGRAEAESLYRRITTEGPANFSGAWQQLSDIARDRGDYQGTYELARRAVNIDPCDIRAHFSLFQYYRYVGDAAGAAIHADWVARCNPMLFREVNLPVPEGAY
jgi:tetratricopeptide (TPR) repeat protein